MKARAINQREIRVRISRMIQKCLLPFCYHNAPQQHEKSSIGKQERCCFLQAASTMRQEGKTS
jgi:hypothetical protein